MRLKAAPLLILSLAALVAAIVASAVILAASTQPWTGLVLAPQGDGVVIVAAKGPASGLPVGGAVERFSGAGREVWIAPLDLTPEPDGAMGDYATYRRFLDRQESLSQIFRADELRVILTDGTSHGITPESRRPFRTLPVAFWVQLAVGLIAWAIAASVFAFRKTDASARFLLLSGAATLTFAPLAGVYSTRELALPGTLFQWLNDLNFLGGSLFAASFVALLLNYPRRIGPNWLGAAVVAVFVGWFVAQQMGAFESMTFARRFLVMIGVFATFALAGWHWFTSRREPATRAALQWFLLSWVAGTGLFALFILLPQMFGIDTSSLQGYAFLLFLLVYGGLAFGILRYRLFDLDRWWTGALLWLLVALLLIGLDFLFLFVLHFSSEISLALALLVCGIFWLPLRGLIWAWLFGKRDGIIKAARFRQITDVALAPPGADKTARWKALLSDIFRPLGMEARGGIGAVTIEEEGLALVVPGTDGLTAMRLSYADGGRRLFGPRDISLTEELIDMLAAAAESRKAYERGVLSERGRIARDIHDNIGAQLMGALHSRDYSRKDLMIRETLTDLRDIINDAATSALSFDEMLADLRSQISEHFFAAGVAMDWRTESTESVVLPLAIAHTLRSIVREAVQNALKHAEPRMIRIAVRHEARMLAIHVADDGKGFEVKDATGGNGLSNMRTRATSLGGRFDIISGLEGTVIEAHIPLSSEPATMNCF